VIAVLAFCGIVVSIMQTLVVPIITHLPRLLDTTQSNASWVITATLLASAVATPVMGRAGDMFGKRRVVLVCLGLLVIGSVLCALTSSLPLVILGRAFQGAAMGVVPLGISIMRDELPVAKLPSAIAVMSASMGIGGALGLPVAAWLAQHADWHAMFWMAGGLGLLGLVLVVLVVPESPVRTPGRFDFPGAAMLSAGLLCLLLPISKGGDWGWGSARTLGLFAASLLVLLGWGWFELRQSQPLVDLRVSARPQVLLTNGATVVVGFAMYAMNLVMPQILQLPETTGYGLGKSMVVAGLCMAPGGIAMMLVSPLSARLSQARGPKVSLVTGIAIIALGYGIAPWLLDAVWKMTLVGVVICVGIAFAYGAMPALIMQAVPRSETGSANGLNSLMRAIGTSTSAAVASAVLANMAVRSGGYEIPSLDGFKTVLWIGCGAAVLGIVLSLLIPAKHERLPAAAGPVAKTPEPARR
jgi:MFS family permease